MKLFTKKNILTWLNALGKASLAEYKLYIADMGKLFDTRVTLGFCTRRGIWAGRSGGCEFSARL